MAGPCKRCGASLPAVPDAPLVRCESCGAVSGTLPEVERWVEAVIAGADDPPPLYPGVSAEFRAPFGGGSAFRDAGAPAAELTVEMVTRRDVRELAAAAAAVPALLAIAWCFYRAGLRWFIVLVGGLVGLLAWGLLGRLRLHARLRVADGVLEYTAVEHGLRGKRVVRVPVNEIRQLYVAREKDETPLYELRLRRHDGSSLLLDQFRGPTVTLALEALAERALGIENRPEEGELDRLAPAPRVKFSLLGVVAPMTVFCAVAVGFAEVYGDDQEPMFPSDAAAEQTIEVAVPVTLYFSSWLYFSKEQPTISQPFGSVASLPRSVAFQVDVLPAGSPEPIHTLRCDPYDFRGPTFTGSGDAEAFFFGGFMRGCSLALEAGSYAVRARAEPLDEDAGAALGLFKRRLEPRIKRRLW